MYQKQIAEALIRRHILVLVLHCLNMSNTKDAMGLKEPMNLEIKLLEKNTLTSKSSQDGSQIIKDSQSMIFKYCISFSEDRFREPFFQ